MERNKETLFQKTDKYMKILSMKEYKHGKNVS